jgi:DNA modification methylase
MMQNVNYWLEIGDSAKKLKRIKDGSIDLVVTSPPYDNIRKYNGFQFDFHRIARHLARVIKPGGVIVWVVADQTKNGTESLTSFKQALYFREKCGLLLHDTMIYERSAPPLTHKRYEQHFEYMFVFSKGRPVTFNGIRTAKTYKERVPRDKGYTRNADGSRDKGHSRTKFDDPTKLESNVWSIAIGRLPKYEWFVHRHPAIFPQELARRHILSWSNVGDIVLDPFCGCGTTGKMALQLGRKFIGIDMSPEYMEITKQLIEVNKPFRVTQC